MKPHDRLGMSPASFWTLAHEQSTQTNPRQANDTAEEAFWVGYAPDYDTHSPLAYYADTLIADVVPLLRPADHLLEIGPGSGAFTRRLAGHVAHVTGVEPSAAMRETLIRQWPAESGPLPTLIADKWEVAAAPVADVVFAANALYRIADIGAALAKMMALALRRVVLVQTIARPFAGPLVVSRDGNALERERADALCDVLDAAAIPYRRRDYMIMRGEGQPCAVALIDWTTGER